MKDTNKAIKHMFFLYPIALPLFLLVYLCFPIPAIAVENRETVVAFTEVLQTSKPRDWQRLCVRTES